MCMQTSLRGLVSCEAYLQKKRRKLQGRRGQSPASPLSHSPPQFGKGQIGSALMGLLQICKSYFFWQRDLLGTPVNLLNLPKSDRAYLFPQSVKNHYFCSGPISVDPICPQPRGVHRPRHYVLRESCIQTNNVYVYIYIYIYITLSLSLYIYIYIYIHGSLGDQAGGEPSTPKGGRPKDASP